MLKLGLLLLLAGAACGLYSPSDDVIELTPSNFDSEVAKGDGIWLVEFYAPWKKAATALKGIVNIAAVDAQQHQSLGGQFGVKGFPTIKLFGENKKQPEDYQAQKLAKKRLKGGASSSSSSNNKKSEKKSSGGGGGGKDHVVTLGADNFDDEVEFFAPWCGHCKNLAPEWKKAAAELAGKVKIGAVDATIESSLAQKYGVQGYPTIKVWKSGTKGDPVDYQGGRTASDIVRYALNLYEAHAPAPEIKQLLSQEQFTEHCGSSTCVIAFVPHIMDSGAQVRNGYIDVLKKTADGHKRKPFAYLWAEAFQQEKLEAALGIGGFGYPAVAAVNLKKSRYVSMVRAFNADNLSDFLKDVMSGREATVPISGKLPEVVTVSPWDGKGDAPVRTAETFDDLDLE